MRGKKKDRVPAVKKLTNEQSHKHINVKFI